MNSLPIVDLPVYFSRNGLAAIASVELGAGTEAFITIADMVGFAVDVHPLWVLEQTALFRINVLVDTTGVEDVDDEFPFVEAISGALAANRESHTT